MKIRIGGVQLGPGSKSMMLNAKKIMEYIQAAEKLKIDILCLPELCVTTYFPKNYYESLEEFILADKDLIFQKILSSTSSINTGIIFPYAECTKEGLFNTAVVIQKGIVIGKYRKIHLPILQEESKYKNLEEKYFNVGNLGFPVFNIKGINIGVQICFDRHFPEGFRILGLKGAQIIFVPTNSALFDTDPNRLLIWERLMQIRAYENSTYIVAVNKAGNEEGWEFMGSSLIVDKEGKILQKASKNEEEILFQDINIEDNMPKCKFFSKRRPEAYKELLET